MKTSILILAVALVSFLASCSGARKMQKEVSEFKVVDPIPYATEDPSKPGTLIYHQDTLTVVKTTKFNYYKVKVSFKVKK